MKVLSKNLTEKTSEIVSSIEKSVHLPIAYYSVKDRPNKSYGVAGTIDVSGESGSYSIWLDTTLPPEAFEVNLLHELRHILQTEASFSMVYNKPSLALFSNDRDFIKEVGSHLASVVLDIDVNRWLRQMGYSSSFFAQSNLTYLIQHAGARYPGLADPLNFANLVLSLLIAVCDIDDKDADRLYEAYHTYPKAVESASHLRDQLLSMPLDSPGSTCLAHCILVDGLGLWKYYYVAAGDQEVRTHQEYLSFCAEVGVPLDK